MSTSLTYIIYNSTTEIPSTWNKFAESNVFLSTNYLKILDFASPENMTCHYIGFYDKEELVGIAIGQFFDLNKQKNFGERDRCIKTSVRNFVFKNLASRVLMMGNNMLTGQNAYQFDTKINPKIAFQSLIEATHQIKKRYKSISQKIHLTSYKDFNESEIENIKSKETNKLYTFCTQPNMVFEIPDLWTTELDYVAALSKKYRDQYKRARKKCEGIEKTKMSLQDIINQEDVIYNLYLHVAQNAPFNTFFLPKNHFSVFKEYMTDHFLFYGYYINDRLIGFNTLIKNGDTMETYFLGYDETIQKDKMLYLNMLYDMIGYSIKKNFKRIVFARTALEIKSSVGAQPVDMFGLIEHENKLLNWQMERIFTYIEPKTIWKERNPFKE